MSSHSPSKEVVRLTRVAPTVPPNVIGQELVEGIFLPARHRELVEYGKAFGNALAQLHPSSQDAVSLVRDTRSLGGVLIEELVSLNPITGSKKGNFRTDLSDSKEVAETIDELLTTLKFVAPSDSKVAKLVNKVKVFGFKQSLKSQTLSERVESLVAQLEDTADNLRLDIDNSLAHSALIHQHKYQLNEYLLLLSTAIDQLKIQNEGIEDPVLQQAQFRQVITPLLTHQAYLNKTLDTIQMDEMSSQVLLETNNSTLDTIANLSTLGMYQLMISFNIQGNVERSAHAKRVAQSVSSFIDRQKAKNLTNLGILVDMDKKMFDSTFSVEDSRRVAEQMLGIFTKFQEELETRAQRLVEYSAQSENNRKEIQQTLAEKKIFVGSDSPAGAIESGGFIFR